jgi:hypothetical protein
MSSQIDDIQYDDNKCENCDTTYLNKVYTKFLNERSVPLIILKIYII